jgi:hypothetical protein
MIRKVTAISIVCLAGLALMVERSTLADFTGSLRVAPQFSIEDTKKRTNVVAHDGGSQEAQRQHTKSRRKLVSYTPSAWEQMWLDSVDRWAVNHTICEHLMSPEQSRYLHDFLNLSCTTRYAASSEYPGDLWCIIDDGLKPFWYDTADQENVTMLFRKPMRLMDKDELPKTEPPRMEDYGHVLSKFVFLDETTDDTYDEYIEPLVAALRHPLAHCARFKTRMSLTRSYVIPPTATRAQKRYYFDAGASSWGVGAGGPSLPFFWDTWAKQGIHFDQVHAFELTTPASEFYATVPKHLASHQRVNYQQCAVSSRPSLDTPNEPFLPKLIKRTVTNRDDYVLFKLDIDSPDIEAGNIDFILQDEDNYIDEIAWEHHVDGNYLMLGQWGNLTTHMSLYNSYQYFLKLRQKGIRAHSWV